MCNWHACWQRKARTTRQREELQNGLQGNSPATRVALELGTLYLKAGKNAEAEQQFRLAVQRLPKDAEAHYALGSLLMHEKKYPEAQQELLMAVKLKPDLATHTAIWR